MYPLYLECMSIRTFKCCITFKNGTPAITTLIQATHAPQAREFAEARYPGGTCRSANTVSR